MMLCDYNITVIQEESVPLSVSAHSQMIVSASLVWWISIITIFGIGAVYLINCFLCRRKIGILINQLQERKNVYRGLHYFRLRDTVKELEQELLEQENLRV